jgi:protein involved in polysaccharide export with SLBB domain
MQKRFFTTPLSVVLAICSTALFLFTSPTFAQETTPFLTQIRNLTPKQQFNYIIEARNRGYSLLQLEGLAKAQGATLEDLSLLRTAWSDSQSGGVDENQTQNVQGEEFLMFGNEPGIFDFFEEEEESDIFGSAFFANKNITETPQFYVATPSGYRLGPSDEITIDVWGASENRYEVTLSRQGVVRIDRLKPMYLSGLTLAAAERKIRNEFSSIYTGLSPDSPNESKVYLDLNLQKARSIVVNITGSVEAPGTYTISGFSSVLNALYAAGGPTENGSYRDISILRNGKEVASIDLYDYFVKGTYPSFFLNDQDVIVVAPHHKRIRVNGAFKNTGLFETLENETIEDLLSYTGGFSSRAYKKAVYVDRVAELQREIIKIEHKAYVTAELSDGDTVEAKNVTNNYTNRIRVSGEVYLPGNYPLNETPTLSALLKSASGLTQDAYAEAAILYRSKQGFINEIKTIDLAEIINNSQDVQLQPNDSLVVISMENINPEKTVRIQGVVKKPREVPFFKGMTARDLILIADGFQDRANTNQIELYTNVTEQQTNKRIDARWFSFDEAKEVELEPSDLMVVRLKPGYQSTTFVRLEGQVSRPGTYPIIKENYTIYDLFYDAGEALEGANLKGVSVERVVTKETQQNIEDTADSLNLFLLDDTKIKIGVNFEKVLSKKGNHRDNVLLKPNDLISFPKEDSTISVLGEVQRETATPYDKRISLREAVNRAGGVKQSSDYKNAYVVYQNGDVRGTKNFLFFRTRPKLEPGAIVVVPVKDKRRTITLQETITATSALASLTLLVRSLIQN